MKLDKSDEDKIHKLIFRDNPRFITQLITQMNTIDIIAIANAMTNKYDAIERIALNLEQAIAIVNAARPQRHDQE